MSETFFTADLHLGHRKMIEFRGFTTMEEHDEAIIDRWNARVRKRDTVWVLGDVLFRRSAFAYLPRLNGTKKMVSGNHDNYPTSLYLEHFNRVCGAVEVAGCILTHIPVHPSQFFRYKFNIHGHLHDKRIDHPRYICVSLEQNNLTPIAIDDIIGARE